MAQPLSEPSEIALAIPAVPDSGYAITLKRYNPAGGATSLNVRIPEGATLASIRDNPLLLSAVLKDGDPVWRDMEPGFILVAVLHAASLGLDILQGDIYPIEGRLAVSDKGKIRHARSQNRYRHEVVIFPDGPVNEFCGAGATPDAQPLEMIDLPWETKRERGVFKTPNYRATCRIYDKEWGAVPVCEYKTDLKTWFKGSNPNWRRDPMGMLRLRVVAKAYEEVCPVGTEPEEAPPLTPSPINAGVSPMSRSIP